MINKVKSGILYGIGGKLIDIEVDISKGLPMFNIVGLAGVEVKESKERVRSAVSNSGFDFPMNRIVVNLSPADLKKDGSYLDLGVCIGILRKSIKCTDKYLEKSVFLGELSLDGHVRTMDGVFSIVLSMLDYGIERVFIPYGNYMECSELNSINIIPIFSVKDCVNIINMDIDKRENKINERKINIKKNHKYYDEIDEDEFKTDMSEIKGNKFAKRCAEISIAGAHNFLMIGPPGTGKTMIAKSMESILTKPSKEDSIAITRIMSSSGNHNHNIGLIKKRPFRQPHHSATKIAIIGGGSGAKLGEITLAHKGVLFFDELPEFDRNTIDSLRQPLEDRCINISRINHNITYPADFIFVATMNPCPCGYYNSSKTCVCRQNEIDRYRTKISGPILDRIDLFCEVSEINYEKISSNGREETSEDIRRRVLIARDIQKERLSKYGIDLNSHMSTELVLRYCNLSENAEFMIKSIYNKYGLNNRSYLKILKVARTIADLRESDEISEKDIMESFSYRRAYYKYFGNRI